MFGDTELGEKVSRLIGRHLGDVGFQTAAQKESFVIKERRVHAFLVIVIRVDDVQARFQAQEAEAAQHFQLFRGERRLPQVDALFQQRV